MSSAPQPFVIRMYLPEGLPDGIRIVERSNWVGQAVICPHGSFGKLKARTEADGAGVYVLLGREEDDDLPTAYIGEADPIIDRLVIHYKQKEWWDTVVFFVSKDQQLNKAHIQYLEARLVQMAGAANRCKLENGNVPAQTLSEMDEAEMEGFLAHMLQIYPVAGVNLFQSPMPTAAAGGDYHLSLKQAQATGVESPEGFIVRAGLPARKRNHVVGVRRGGRRLVPVAVARSDGHVRRGCWRGADAVPGPTRNAGRGQHGVERGPQHRLARRRRTEPVGE